MGVSSWFYSILSVHRHWEALSRGLSILPRAAVFEHKTLDLGAA